MQIKLRSYQIEAVEKINAFFWSDVNKAKIHLASGLGKSSIIISSIERILEKKKNALILILFSRRVICYQFEDAVRKVLLNVRISKNLNDSEFSNVCITTYQAFYRFRPEKLEIFDLIICDEAHFLKSEKHKILFDSSLTKYLGIMSTESYSEGWFRDVRCIYVYTLREAFNDGYFEHPNERQLVENFFVPLLSTQRFKNVQTGVLLSDYIKVDMSANKGEDIFVFEVKVYRGLYNPHSTINAALNQIISYKEALDSQPRYKKISFVIILLCKVEESFIHEVFDKYKITIWDISNIIYLCNNNNDLINSLSKYLPYSIIDIKGQVPINLSYNVGKRTSYKTKTPFAKLEYFQNKLDECQKGRNSARTYEIICTEIVNYLFHTEFTQISEQHRTGDDMFCMDLLCGLKGTTEFWKFLMRFYNTKFIVFEYKNYSDYISQNLIYTTEKYLFSMSLRNVAFIISRLGFSPNAKKAALGCLKEHGKLIISLNDEDLLKMIAIKVNGEEPSDYLLYKVENLLMSVDK